MSRNSLTDPWKSSGPVLHAVKVAAGNIGAPPNGVVEIGICFAPFARPRELKSAELARLRAGLDAARH